MKDFSKLKTVKQYRNSTGRVTLYQSPSDWFYIVENDEVAVLGFKRYDLANKLYEQKQSSLRGKV